MEIKENSLHLINILDFKQYFKWLTASILVLILLVTMPYITVLADECGSFISEYLIGRSGVSTSTLTLERSGVADSILDVGLGAIVTTQAATNITLNSGTLNGNLTDLNGMPRASVYFEWGYTAAYGNSTTPQTLTGTGSFNAAISSLTSDTTVHFRSVSETDATYYGADQTFDTLSGSTPSTPSGGSILGVSSAGNFVQYLIPVAIAVMVLIGVIRNAKSPIHVLLGTVIGLVTFFVARVIIGIVW